MFNRILCPLDGSDHAARALELAIDLAKKYNAALILVHALLRTMDSAGLRRFAEAEGLAKDVEAEVHRLKSSEGSLGLNLGPAYGEQAPRVREDSTVSSRALIEIGRHILGYAKSDAQDQGVSHVSTLVVDGDPADQILRCIDEQNIDCVVMGSRGLSDIKGVLLGSVSHKVANRASCTCIAVK